MRDVPPSVLATWPLPNYVDPHRNPATIALYVINGVFLGLATIAVAARLYTRIVIRNWFGLDDLCVILAFVGLLDRILGFLMLISRFRSPRSAWPLALYWGTFDTPGTHISGMYLSRSTQILPNSSSRPSSSGLSHHARFACPSSSSTTVCSTIVRLDGTDGFFIL